LHLAKLLKLGEIVEVRVPSVEQEGARDLVRAREDVRGDLMRCRHRLSKLLLRQGIVHSGGQPWTLKHDVWLRSQTFDQPGRMLAFDAAYEAMLLTSGRRDRLDVAITAMALDSEFTEVVHRLSCLRGVSTLTAFGLAVEVGDWHRFSGNTIGADLGLVPTEHSSGASRSLGSITKTGNGHARRLLVEAAWHHRKTYRSPGAIMRARWEQAPPAARARGHEGNQRLHQRWQVFTDRKKKPVIANVAIARELAGAGHSRSWNSTPGPTDVWPGQPRNGRSAWNDPRNSYEQSSSQLEDHARSLDLRMRSSRTARPAVTNPRISV